jgi:hypothetical protein
MAHGAWRGLTGRVDVRRPLPPMLRYPEAECKLLAFCDPARQEDSQRSILAIKKRKKAKICKHMHH